jgi:hypothetical protein
MKFSHALITAVMTAAFGSFLYWYGGSGEPLTAAEREDILSYVKEKELGDDICNFIADVTSKDDGNEVLFVNLIKFRESAYYDGDDEGSDSDGDVSKARVKYMKIMAVEFLSHASHPIFASSVFSFLRIGEVLPEEYDEIAIVRYRSIRDFVDILRRVNDAGGFKHKYASVLRSAVHIARPKLVFPLAKVIAAVVFVIIRYAICSII